MTARRAGPWIALLAFALAVLGTVVVLFAPLTTVVSTEVPLAGEAGDPSTHTWRVSTIQSGDRDAVVAAAIPLVLAALPLPFLRSRFAHLALIASAALLSAFALVASFSIGWAYLPAAVTMWIAAALEGRRSKAVAAGST